MKAGLILESWPLFAEGVWITVQLTVLALALGLCLAVPVAFVRLRRVRGLSALADGYVALFRGTPLLVQLYMVYFGLSQFEWLRDSWAWALLREAWWCALITFALNSGAYASEILRGALAATPAGELEAARALGLRPRQVDRLVLLPAALRRSLPQLGNEVVFMLHGSAVASVITLQDILGAGRALNARYYLAYEGLLTAAALYMLVTLVVVGVFRALERRYLRHLALAPVRVRSRLPAMR
ncbi:ABC transporter permease subunit [Rhodobacteraceae bacterium 2CG4]|uniref:ABC transporter permease subunit n=1 Tax=Halovulum marinum TaxID=2662447 RepID=A0A6L5Z108_9RHOB|nr:ABC transporter permease subunit [Halovulum marinum]MSU89772.1 ABC transporter permease subunit [Halovulum marinum]